MYIIHRLIFILLNKNIFINLRKKLERYEKGRTNLTALFVQQV
jgi:hypothetical protein